MRRRVPAILLLPLAALLMVAGARAVPLEVYGRLPALEEVSLSPEGSRIAFVRTSGNARLIQLISLADRSVLGSLRIGEQKVRSREWADSDHLLIETSATTPALGLRNMKYELTLLQIYDVAKGEARPVPDPGRRAVTDLIFVLSGRVMVRKVQGHTVLFVPGFYLKDKEPPALRRIDLQTGREKVIRQVDWTINQWLVDAGGELVAEQQYDEDRQRWALRARHDGALTEVASGKAALDPPTLLGLGPSDDTLVVRFAEDDVPVWRPLSLQDGTLGPAIAEARELDAPIEDGQTHRMIGGVRVDDDLRYVFFDRKLQARWDAVLRAFEGDRVRFVSASADYRKFIVRVEGPKYGFLYELVDIDKGTAVPLGGIYEGVTAPRETRRITYPAADGLQIPAYLTLPPGLAATKLPLVVLPHGGPAARDTAEFDWWSQALADQGYAVLRPNYRGSTVSRPFRAAGFGEWGRKMQTDLSDGVRYLAQAGTVDPARVCIVGASYGGYAALAGATLAPGVYRCAVSVAGISDLKRYLTWVNERRFSAESYAQRYWDRFLGITGLDDPLLDNLSPIKHIDALSVRVLLIHGRDDTVVAFEQSEIMADAICAAKKSVQLVELKGEDHWLSRGETRLQMLQATATFLRAHNPPDASTNSQAVTGLEGPRDP